MPAPERPGPAGPRRAAPPSAELAFARISAPSLGPVDGLLFRWIDGRGWPAARRRDDSPRWASETWIPALRGRRSQPRRSYRLTCHRAVRFVADRCRLTPQGQGPATYGLPTTRMAGGRSDTSTSKATVTPWSGGNPRTRCRGGCPSPHSRHAPPKAAGEPTSRPPPRMIYERRRFPRTGRAPPPITAGGGGPPGRRDCATRANPPPPDGRD